MSLKFNLKRRELLRNLSSDPFAGAPRFSLFEDLTLRIQRKETCGIVGIFKSGKSSLAKALAVYAGKKLGLSNTESILGDKIYLSRILPFAGTDYIGTLEENARKFGILIVDEATLLFSKDYKKQNDFNGLFFDLVLRLRSDNIPAILVYHKSLVDLEFPLEALSPTQEDFNKRLYLLPVNLQAKLPFMKNLIVPAKMTKQEILLWFEFVFSNTGVILCEEVKAKIISESERYAILVSTLTSQLLNQFKIHSTLDIINIVRGVPPISIFLDRWIQDLSGLYRSLVICLTQREKDFLRRVVMEEDTSDYSYELKNLLNYGVIDQNSSDSVILRKFVESGLTSPAALKRII